MTLTGKQKNQLKALGQRMDAGVHLGKAGLTKSLVDQAKQELSRCELIKVRFPRVAPADRKKSAQELATALSACMVGMVGRTALFYKANEHLPPDRRIGLS